ncbi:putative membrane lipoprotein [Perilla frutescens var. hirtella]|uniref:Membrane lipoprotein n=1 Tax=Perilla frutescens var. hirtella TaxID=608512 RepID=A0AAD4JC17_PERFH|nr:putative membrane lipoprotein [Perilla frutescens var. frutescens]KAH6792466.1 putative membrane lipoprotein [Perilla frutescens var. hirtella]KAH6831031.1 putative membrane lipoprotein [Perilla frutescens var. hirtella]
MQKNTFTLLQTVSIAGVFSAVSCWYGFMFGKESARKELSNLIETLRRTGSDPAPPPPEHS